MNGPVMAGELGIQEPPVGTALVAPKPFDMGTYLDGVANDRAIQAQQQLVIAYDRAVRALVGANDVQKAQGKEFKKKSAWRKLARYFGVSTSIVREESHRDDEGHLVSTVVVRAVAPWGQYMEAIAKCSTRESRFKHDVSKADHDCPATAQTRASNRAIADLIAAGEVSAEEMEFGETPAATRRGASPRGEATSAAVTQEHDGGEDPATDKQIEFLGRLLRNRVWSQRERVTFAAEGETASKRQMMALLDKLTVEGKKRQEAEKLTPPAISGEPGDAAE